MRGNAALLRRKGAQVDRQRAVPAFHRELLDGPWCVGAGGVDQHVYAAELLDGPFDTRRGLLLSGQIRG
jgi:hypothetical protein